ncbi:ABC transporter ATP-binding protein [Frondihabitans sucicola]|uniref:ABC transporter ATP-binding protein n=1 Tax=Frondihabitans sucicola TaxID=1268041 RepID=A0ABN6XVA7_9MICO|nr:ATP-binding cassette domain-containing protein [Frondihabitans sucicola]BDZ48898.1 ABC transporter ATP-binding protein [Frondihabitans sucicola]
MTTTRGHTLVVDSLVVRHRRRHALDGLSFEAGRGVLAVLGPNGAGKSTLFRVLAGLAKRTSGVVLFDGDDYRDRSGLRAVRATLGFQPQAPVFNTGFTVLEAVRYAAWLKGVGRRESAALVDRALGATHLTDLASRQVRRLSGGQQKRTAIAQAIVHEPHLVVLDEPTASLDPTERQAVLEIISRLGRRATVLVSTHITSDLAAATDVLVLDAGRAQFSGSKRDFRERTHATHATDATPATDLDVWEAAYAAVRGAT